MRRPFHLSRAIRCACLFSLAAVSLLAGCGKLRNWYVAREESRKPHSVTISWTTSNPPVAGYNVYRETQSSPPVKLTAQIVVGTQYTDPTVEAGRIYSYYVTSVDSKGLESKPSARITVTVPTTTQSPAK